MATPHNSATGAEASPVIYLKPSAFARLADGNRMLGKVREGEWEPNLAAIARSGGIDKGVLSRLVSGDQQLTKKVIEAVIAASGKPWLDALAEYFDYGTPPETAHADEPEMAVAA